MNDRALHAAVPTAGPPLAGQADPALPAGMRLGAFEIQRVIARSASAVVYLAIDHALAMPVAIQEYLPERLVRRDAGLRLVASAHWHDDLIERGSRAFVDEARLLAGCDHPSLVRVLHLFDSLGSVYRVMPLYEGRRLSERRHEMAAMPDEIAVRALLEALLGAIEAIHRSGQVHGGVTAANILLLADDRPLLLGPGAAAREIVTDLVTSLMATLEPPSRANRAAEPDAGSPPTGTALDLYGLAEAVRFFIAGELPVAPEALQRREPLQRVIDRALPAGTRPVYSTALLGALDAAVSAHPENRPLSVAQFRDWLVRGVPAVPGRRAARMAPAPAPPPFATPASQAGESFSTATTTVQTPAPPPAPAAPVAEHAVPPWPRLEEPAFDTPFGSEADEPLAPWPERVRGTEPRFEGRDEPDPPLPTPVQRLTQSRRRRYKTMLGGALAALAAGVLLLATGAWNRAPEIPLGPLSARTDPTVVAGPTPGRLDAPPAAPPAEPLRAPLAGAPDAARLLADAPPSAGPTPRATRSASEADLLAAPPAPPAQTAPPARPPRPVPRTPPVRATSPGPGPRAACAGRSEFALYRCMQQQCQAKRWAAHPQCVRLRRNDRVD